MDSDVRILPDLMRESGYRTGYFGKWHLGDPARDAWDVMPAYLKDGRGNKHYYEVGGKQVYQTDVLSADAIRFMEADPDKPFCCFASFHPPHPPYSVPEKYEAMYAEQYHDDENRRKYYAMCTAVDDAVGRLLASLEEQSIADNTLVVFTTEHGHQFDHRWNNHNKRLCYDIAARIPMLMRFPGVIPAGQAGDGLISSVDLFQTMTGLLGLKAGEGLDGRDLGPLIRGKTNDGRESLVMVNVPFIDKSSQPRQPHLVKGEERCIVRGNWKLILSTVRQLELYHLPSDPRERSNRWEDQKESEVAGQLTGTLRKWAVQTRDPLTPMLLNVTKG
jgi:arylsulfatase A-like enzyme